MSLSDTTTSMEMLQQKLASLNQKLRSADVIERIGSVHQWSQDLLYDVRSIGVANQLDDYEKRKLGIFNQLNFFQLLTGILIPIAGLLHHDRLPFSAWMFACLPALTSLIVLGLNYLHKHESALYCYFLLYPFFTCIVYIHGMNTGTGLHFVLYGVLSVFFLQDIGFMLFSIALSMVSYFVLSVLLKGFIYQLESENKILYLINQGLAILFLFYGLFLIKKENSNYQLHILNKNKVLNQMNIEIKRQAEEITEKARLLEQQKTELAELNQLKNKLFSVISHDLKTPMYALRNLFRNIHQFNLPAEEVKELIPDVLTDLNYTISLMENLLEWSKSQMHSNHVKAQEVNISRLITDVLQLLRLQAEAKQICLNFQHVETASVLADKDMVHLVLRNLISNAIKFTPIGGKIEVGINELPLFIEVYVEDSGIGISKEALQRIKENNFYTTNGTASESGTGLGLMLCTEFLAKNGGQMQIESKPGEGSTFSFTLPVVSS
jgi:signal transduction histidine kinase